MSSTELNELDEYLLNELCKKKCQFYKDGQENSEKDYRCGAYMVIKYQLEKEFVTKDQLFDLIKNTIKLEYEG
ncbi:MAG: hypothetical protein EAX96_00515 [Candidatus Lokiarchaeota archaeon]|nr:hypothetical protein [Candidatus Lokiarchaeota archaeon]